MCSESLTTLERNPLTMANCTFCALASTELLFSFSFDFFFLSTPAFVIHAQTRKYNGSRLSGSFFFFFFDMALCNGTKEKKMDEKEDFLETYRVMFYVFR